jgi:hypothetical protein
MTTLSIHTLVITRLFGILGNKGTVTHCFILENKHHLLITVMESTTANPEGMKYGPTSLKKYDYP